MRINANPAPVCGTFKLDLARVEREESVISADANVNARMKLGASLADYDAACFHYFAAKTLHAKHLGLGIATVSR